MAAWHIRYGPWWMIQWSINGWLSLGIHIDWRRRPISDGRSYGPYIDLHLGPVILSIGRNPVYSGNLELDISTCRGGITVDSHG